MSVDYYDCACCSNTGVYEEFINCCEGCGERICTDCANEYDEETCKLLDCPICWEIAKDLANPHKDFLGKALNIWDAVVAIWGRTSRTYLYKWVIKTLSPIRATVTSPSWKNTSIEKDLLIKI